ncbi:MAG: hypothetical protein F6J95_023380 [Leptolyngbya sp. SIO1E4]|nr:hypothetical protein [Leptolyngbya sp. SIO1E4]
MRSLLRIAFEVGYLEKTKYEALRDRMIGLSRLLAGQIRAIRSTRKAVLRAVRTYSQQTIKIIAGKVASSLN